MKRWIAPLASLFAVAGVVALALFLAGVFDGDEASGDLGDGSEVAGVCAEGHPDCVDTVVAPNGDEDDGNRVAPGCEVGHVGVCDDTPIADDEAGELIEGDGPVIQPVCAPGFPDCIDTVVVTDRGEEVGDFVVPIGTFDDDHQSGSQGPDDGVADGAAVHPGSFATSGGATTPAE